MTMESSTPQSQTDVLIIGAGPSGLMAAQALARLGISVQIVDRRGRGTQYGQADGLQPRTLEIWQTYGMFDKIFPKSAAMHAIVMYEQHPDGKGFKRSVPAQNIVVPARYPFELTANIETIEEILRNEMEEAGTQVIQPVMPLSIDFLPKATGSEEERTHPVKVVLKHLPSGHGLFLSPLMDVASRSPPSNRNCQMNDTPPEIEVVYAKYVIGADGAYSWVRRQLGIRMEGEQTEYVWGVMDVTVDTDFPDCRFKCVLQSSIGAIIIIPREEEKIRIYVQLSPQDSIKTSDGRLDKSALSHEIVRAKVLARAQEGFRPYRLEYKHVFWCTIFSVPQKVANCYSIHDRVFIVGDACHTHSPKAGQGANASMGDSHNLAWKLAYVLRGWARPSLLDSYETERRTYAQDLIAFDKRFGKTLNAGTAATYQSVLHELNLFTSGVGIHYKSQLTFGDPDTNPYAFHIQAGQRLPPGPIIRLGDWQPIDIQDILPSDGLFKLTIFACDILLSDQITRLNKFAGALEQSMSQGITERLSLLTILSSQKEKVHWKDVPPVLQCWKRVFISQETEGNGVYAKFGVACEGCAVLVRPDGYISMLTELSERGAHQITNFLLKL